MEEPAHDAAVGGVFPPIGPPIDGVYTAPTAALDGHRRTRGTGRVAVALATVVAMVATGFGIAQIAQSDGAETPEAAVEALFQAIGEEDALGVMESLPPEERDVLVPSVRKMADELQRVEMVDDGLDLGDIEGLEIEVEGLQLETQELHPDVASVQVTGGTLRTTADFRRLPLGSALSAALEEAGGMDLDEGTDDTEELDEVRLATVRRDGGWHVSLLYTLAEMDRIDSERAVPDFGNEIPAKGAETPEGAIEAMVAAFNDENYTRMIELTPPDTMGVLHDYGADWIDDPDGDEDDEFEETNTLELTLGELSGSMTERTFPVATYRWEQIYDGDTTFSIAYDGTCTTTMYRWFDMDEGSGSEQEPVKVCPGDESDEVGFGGMGMMFGPSASAGLGRLEVTVVQRGGSWFVDPARSLSNTVVAYLTDVSPEDARTFADYWALMFNDDGYAMWAYAGPEFYEECPGVDPPAKDATFAERKEAGEACQEEAGYNDEYTEYEEDMEGYEDAYPEDECYEEVDNAEIEACLQELVDAGEIPADELAAFRCNGVYEELEQRGNASDEEWEAADDAFEQCLDDLDTVPPTTTPPTVAPSPTPSLVPTPTTTG